ncbi:hypothetical protein WJX73_010641 [Symbiochloris irregularis]|uniref:Mitotic checkpoint regulator, MAD2B-interacting-domain-containing protein n=1 Tax=Symbiochloris irregularis TaxID=706552 RepID=A0AAW1P3R8_9CHLO
MDLLTGYDSGDNSSGDEAAAPTFNFPGSAQSESAPKASTALPAVSTNGGAGILGALSKLPAPKTAASAPTTAGLRQPRVFKVPLDASKLIDSDEEDEQPAKRAKVVQGSNRLKDFLPAPKHASIGDASLVTPSSQNSRRPAKSAAPAAVHHHQGNGGAWNQHHQDPQAASEGDRMLSEAMAAEQSKARRAAAADPFAALGVEFKEVKQKDLTQMDAATREAANATRTAFGNDYEARLRSEAGAKPDKTARRKHQISSLYHAAKLKELETMEIKSQGLKTKAETQAKYGW